jgi:hypothetical protein
VDWIHLVQERDQWRLVRHKSKCFVNTEDLNCVMENMRTDQWHNSIWDVPGSNNGSETDCPPEEILLFSSWIERNKKGI